MIRKKEEVQELVIDLTGPEGNVFYLLAWASRNWKAALVDEDTREWTGFFDECGVETLPIKDRILTEMKSGDYEHAVQTFDRYFGHFVILER